MEPHEHLHAALKMVNASLFQKEMVSVVPADGPKLKEYKVTISGEYYVDAKDEDDAREKAVAAAFDMPDNSYEVEEVIVEKPVTPAIKVDNGCTIVNKDAKQYGVSFHQKTRFQIAVTAMNEDDASEQVHNLSDLSDYLITDVSDADIYIDDIREVQP